MYNVRFKGSADVFQMYVKAHGTTLVQLYPPFPDVDLTAGFELLTRPKGGKVFGNYLEYTTLYREMDDGSIILSNDGSVYVPPPEPEPVPELEPYVPTLEEVQEAKVAEMNAAQQSVIQTGLDITLSDGTVEHFTLTDHDQTSLMGLQTMVAQGMEKIPWHTSDQTEHCKYYSNADMAIITTKALQFVTYHVTYFRDLRIYIRALQAKEEVEAVCYGMHIPEEYQSEVLKDYLANMEAEAVADENETVS